MEVFRLINMTDFVLQESKGGQQVNSITSQLYHDLRRIKKYANFLKQPLKLEMFVPVDEDGNVLEEKFVENYQTDFGLYSDFEKYNKEYYKAKEKVLFLRFDGSDFDSSLAKVYLDSYFNIEQLSNEVKEQVLTENAIKQLGL